MSDDEDVTEDVNEADNVYSSATNWDTRVGISTQLAPSDELIRIESLRSSVESFKSNPQKVKTIVARASFFEEFIKTGKV